MEEAGNRGSLSLEVLLFLIPFIFFFCIIINAARLTQAQVIIHHAISQTAKEISTYGYVSTRAGITGKVQANNKVSSEFNGDVETVIDTASDFFCAFGGYSDIDYETLEEEGNNAESLIDEYIENPSNIWIGVAASIREELIGYGLEALAGALAKSSIKKELTLSNNNADNYLKTLGVVGGLDGLSFKGSRLITTGTGGSPDVNIVVSYKMKNAIYPQLDIGEHKYIQSVSTLMW